MIITKFNICEYLVKDTNFWQSQSWAYLVFFVQSTINLFLQEETLWLVTNPSSGIYRNFLKQIFLLIFFPPHWVFDILLVLTQPLFTLDFVWIMLTILYYDPGGLFFEILAKVPSWLRIQCYSQHGENPAWRWRSHEPLLRS